MGLQYFQPGPTQTRLYSNRKLPEVQNFKHEIEVLYYLCCENKVEGADQLPSDLAADLDLCLCSRICEKNGFLLSWLIC